MVAINFTSEEIRIVVKALEELDYGYIVIGGLKEDDGKRIYARELKNKIEAYLDL